jgi:hypothetical protein
LGRGFKIEDLKFKIEEGRERIHRKNAKNAKGEEGNKGNEGNEGFG